LRVALVHDWLTGMRGGEKCLEILCDLFPEADLYTLLYHKKKLSKAIERMKINTSYIQHLPRALKYYRYYLPLFPTAIETFNLKGYDLVVSTSHCVAKGVLTPPDTLHVCYCFTPMRYIWDMQFEYFKISTEQLRSFIVSFFSSYLRLWDEASNRRVNSFVAISKHVQKRIQKFYGRESEVIYPPVDCDFFSPSLKASDEESYYLMVTAMVPYKRVDLAIQAFNLSKKPLRIIGEGQEMKALRKMAKKNIEFLGWQSDEKVREFYRGCRAFIFPGEEDFGISPVEAQACGKPVIAYGRGGILETVIPYPRENCTGVFFDRPEAESLFRAVDLFERNIGRFDPEVIRRNALRFHKSGFKDELRSFIEKRYEDFNNER
jgi:glycosyltransferase involved in cell wall biosynthesis